MRIALALLIVLLVSCSDIKNEPRPDDFYGDDKMADIMTDLYLMEAAMTTNRATFADLKTLPSDYIYKKYKTDSVTFKENLYYYSDRNQEYKALMVMIESRLKSVKDTVDARRDKAMKEKGKFLKVKDTVPQLDPDNQ